MLLPPRVASSQTTLFDWEFVYVYIYVDFEYCLRTCLLVSHFAALQPLSYDAILSIILQLANHQTEFVPRNHTI